MIPQVAVPTSSIWRREAYTADAEQASNASVLTSPAKQGRRHYQGLGGYPCFGNCEALAAKQTFPQ
jgi:hypothetical protein